MPAIIPALTLAVSAAGAGYGIEQTQAAQSKMNQDTANVVNQEEALQKRATPIYQQNLQQATKAPALQQGQDQALAQYQKVAAAPASTQPQLVNAPPSKQVDARTQAAVAQGQQANASLQQYPALETAWNVGNTQTNAQLGNLAAIGSSAASTLPANLSLDAAKGQQGQAVGSAIGSLATLGSAYNSAQGANSSYQALLNKLNSFTQQPSAPAYNSYTDQTPG
jgi:hypothetical protein